MDSYSGLRKVKDGNFAFFCEQLTADIIISKLFSQHEMCDTKQILFRRHYPSGVVVKKSSPFRERFTLNWIRMHEIGIKNKIMKYFYWSKITCNFKAHFTSVRLEYVSSIFLFLFIAYFVSICIFSGEIFIGQWKK